MHEEIKKELDELMTRARSYLASAEQAAEKLSAWIDVGLGHLQLIRDQSRDLRSLNEIAARVNATLEKITDEDPEDHVD
jgi:hypothetical protein